MSALNMIDDGVTESKEWVDRLAFLGKSGKMLCLFHADYACEACGTEKGLTLHHLIQRFNQMYMSKEKYLKQRAYYGNQVVLCERCHSKIEKRPLKYWKGHKVISEGVIASVKEELEPERFGGE